MSRPIDNMPLFEKENKRKSEGVCPFCNKKVKISDFKDLLSVKEFKISGLCQKCQDETFKKEV